MSSSEKNEHQIEQGVKECREQMAGAEQARLPLVRLGDLLQKEFKPIPWLVDGLLPAEGLSGLISKPKVGKSTLARQLALAVSRGAPFLGRETKKGLVIFASLEETEQAVADHFRLMGAGQDEEIQVFAGSSLPEMMPLLVKAIKENKPNLVILDTLFRFARVKEVNAYAEVMEATTPLLDAAHEHKCCILALLHAGKMERGGGDEILGSTVILGSLETAVILKRQDSQRTIYTVQRSGEDLPESVLIFDAATRTMSLGAAKKERELIDMRLAIRKFLEEQEEPVTLQIIYESLEGRHEVKVRAIQEGLKAGDFCRKGGGKKGDPHLYFLPASQEKKILVPVSNSIRWEPEMENGRKSYNHATYSGSQFSGTRNENDGFFDDSGKEHFDPLKGVF